MRSLLLLMAVCLGNYCSSQIILKDFFGRNLLGHNIQLVDWEGYMANPAIQLFIQAPPTATFPLTVNLSVNASRLYFNMPSNVGAGGASKTITLTNTSPVSFYISIFPDRDTAAENYTLTINSVLGSQSFTISVLDQDIIPATTDYNIQLDYSADTVYNFFTDPAKRLVVRQAADDWAYFIQNMNFEQVPANNEYTFIWDDGFTSGKWSLNASPYTGFLLYAYGVHDVLHRSGGAPSLHAFQKINGVTTGLRRSGGYNVDPHGNYNTYGWNTSITDDTWYLGTNGGDVPNDLYSIALHEMGHAFCFNPGYPKFQSYKSQGYIDDLAVVAYQQTPVPIDGADHLSNGAVTDSLKVTDRLSRKGAFGSEYAAKVPYGRWLITKLNLLVLKAIGYNIKPTSAFAEMNITSTSLPAGVTGELYSAVIVAKGGVPFYKFEILSGSLPAGITLDGFTGAISGTPTSAGDFSFTIRVTDYDNKTIDKSFSIIVRGLYTFTGNGDWNNAANWSNNLVPPATIASNTEIVINPVAGGQCIYTGTLNIHSGVVIKVSAGKIFHVKQ